jgi:L-ascorbate metabolism protein UlaG (beta-lactamase superfamily)
MFAKAVVQKLSFNESILKNGAKVGCIMKIKWLGHSCFLFTSDNGTRVVTDPFNEEVGYKLPSVEADIVTTSHGHYDHRHVQIIMGDYLHVSQPGSFSGNDVGIKGMETFHDDSEGNKLGENTVFLFEIDGIRLCHCGDLGHILTQEQTKQIGVVDVLLVPVGAIYTVDAKGALEIIKLLKPRVTIPMHFSTKALSFPLESADRFLEMTGGGQRTNCQEIEITRENIDLLPKVIVLDYE